MHNTLIAAVLVVLLVPHLALAQTSFIQETLWSVVNAVFGFFAWLGGQTLNYAVTHYVVGFGHNFLESGTGNSVNILWTVVRDVFNLTFIFGLVYIGLKLILNNGDSRARSMLISLILAALLVNFSLFITKFVIDFSNIAAAQIAAAFPLQNGTHSVSSSFMNILGFNELFSPGATLSRIAGSSASYTYIFSTMFLYIILAFVFMAGGIMLIIRYIVLIIYMILSPVMFLGWVFPGMASVSHSYWTKFMSRAFFAPAYLLMLYFANQVLVSMQGANGMNTGSYGAVFSGQTGTVGNNFGAVIPFFFMTAGFLIASLVVAQKMGAHGADTAVSMGRQAAGRFANRSKKIAVGAGKGAVNVATYAPRLAGREVANRTGAWAEKKLNVLQTKDGWVGKAARTNIVDRKARGAATAATAAQFGTGTSRQAERDYAAKTQSRANQTAAEEARKAQLATAEGVLNNTASSAADLNTELENLAKVMKEMSDSEKEELVLKNKDKKNFKSMAVNLSEGDIEKLEKTGKFSASEIASIKSARTDGFKSVAQHGHTLTDASGTVTHTYAGAVNPGTGKAIINRRTKISSMSTKDAGKLPIDLFKQPQMYDVITPAILEERIRNGVGTDLPLIKNAMYTRLGISPTEVPSDVLLNNDPWVKWEKGNSVYAAQFFA